MIALIDLDSLIYKSKYKIEELEIIQSLSGVLTEERLEEEMIKQSLHRLENIYLRILNEVEETGICFDSYEFYLTTCENSFRKRLDPTYKAKRTFDPLRHKITQRFLKETDLSYAHSELEADDLIADRVNGLEENEYVIIACDKDVLALKGLHFNYYRPHSKKNELMKDMVGLGHNNEIESKKLLATQMLTGDNVDNIKGLNGIGKVKASKILQSKDTDYQLFRSVVSEYYKAGLSKERIKINYRLLKLGDYDSEFK